MPFRTLICLCLGAFLAGCATTTPANKTADTYFKEGEDFYAGKHYEDAIATWKKVKESYSDAEMTARAELKIADAQYESGNYIEAAASYEEFRKFHPKHLQASHALFRQGLCNYRQIDGIDTDQTPVKNAVTFFELFLQEYPKDTAVPEVREKLEESHMKQLAYEIYISRFYLRTGKYPSAIKRLEAALAQYPNAPLHDETLLYLGKGYLQNGENEKGRQAFTRLFTSFPTSRYVDDARKVMEKYY